MQRKKEAKEAKKNKLQSKMHAIRDAKGIVNPD